MLNPKTLTNALDKALNLTGTYPAQVRLLYQNPARSPQAVTFAADSLINCATFTFGLGQRISFSGGVPAAIATGTFYAVPISGTGFKVAATLADALATTPVTVTITVGTTGQVFDLDINAEDTVEALTKYEVTAIAPVSVAKTATAYNATTKKAVATYGPALFSGVATATPISHTLTSFAGNLGDSTAFYDVSPTSQPAIAANGSLTVVISVEAEAAA